jgi:hypothetical protein
MGIGKINVRETTELESSVPINVIRSETVLSKLPIHNLAKKGRVSINIKRRNSTGAVALRWEVSYSEKFGQPRQLAYKLDTLLVNRRIDDERRPLPTLIRLGTLKHICKELQMSENGKNTRDIKTALLQNASAFITANISYKSNDGAERQIDAGFTRYGVVFTGETLPDGRKADAVYIMLNDPYRDVVNHAPTRPLDYDYLRELRPVPQRFYEIISYRIFAALRNNRNEARINYSEFCLFSAQQRYFDHEHFRVQMYKVHKPHLDSGYLSAFRHQPIRDAEGQADWALVYEIGPRARAEFTAFTKKHPQQILIGNTEDTEQLVEQGREETPPSKEDSPLVAQLTKRGITPNQARKLLDSMQPSQNILDQLEWGDQIIRQAKGSFRNPPGFYVSLIRDNISPPPQFQTSHARQVDLEMQRTHEAKLIERQQLEIAYERYQERELDRYVDEQVPAEQLQQAIAAKREELHRQFPSLLVKTLDELSARAARTNFQTDARVLPFEAFCQAHRDEVLAGDMFLRGHHPPLGP